MLEDLLGSTWTIIDRQRLSCNMVERRWAGAKALLFFKLRRSQARNCRREVGYRPLDPCDRAERFK